MLNNISISKIPNITIMLRSYFNNIFFIFAREHWTQGLDKPLLRVRRCGVGHLHLEIDNLTQISKYALKMAHA